MYIPPYYEEKDIEVIKSLIHTNGFATLVTTSGGSPIATHIPIELEIREENRWVLYGHVARANPIWQSLQNAEEVLVIFMGAHTYISSSWYDYASVPTWNYQAVHLYGKAIVAEGDSLVQMLSKLMHRYETMYAAHPMQYTDMPTDYTQQLTQALVGFEIAVTRIEAASKLSQDKSTLNKERVISALEQSPEKNAQTIAAAIKKQIR